MMRQFPLDPLDRKKMINLILRQSTILVNFRAAVKKASPSPVKGKKPDSKKQTKKSPTPSPPKKDTKKGAKKPEPK